MRPIARRRKKGEGRDDQPRSQANDDHDAAVARAAKALADAGLAAPPRAALVAQMAIIAWLGTLGFRSINNPELKAALSAEEPWSLMKLVDKDAAEEAALAAALPVVGEIAASIDPTGQKPLGSYSKDQILQLFEAVVAVWEEHRTPGRGMPPLVRVPEDDIPFDAG